MLFFQKEIVLQLINSICEFPRAKEATQLVKRADAIQGIRDGCSAKARPGIVLRFFDSCPNLSLFFRVRRETNYFDATPGTLLIVDIFLQIGARTIEEPTASALVSTVSSSRVVQYRANVKVT